MGEEFQLKIHLLSEKHERFTDLWQIRIWRWERWRSRTCIKQQIQRTKLQTELFHQWLIKKPSNINGAAQTENI